MSEEECGMCDLGCVYGHFPLLPMDPWKPRPLHVVHIAPGVFVNKLLTLHSKNSGSESLRSHDSSLIDLTMNYLSYLLILGRIYLRQYKIWFSKLDTIMQSLPQTSCDKLQSLDIPSVETIKDSHKKNLGETIS